MLELNKVLFKNFIQTMTFFNLKYTFFQAGVFTPKSINQGVIALWIKQLLCNLCFDAPGFNPTSVAIISMVLSVRYIFASLTPEEGKCLLEVYKGNKAL